MSAFGGCKTSAMGILPHKDVDKALELAFSLDIPFWPQLPHVSYYEDMYVQFSEHFPGMIINQTEKTITFNTTLFYEQLPEYIDKTADPETFGLSEKYANVFHRFFKQDLTKYSAIKGQVMGPISFGMRISDENLKPMIFHDEVRMLMFEFTKEKINHQYAKLRKHNPNAIIFFDEPGLELIFSSISGYTSDMAKRDLAELLSGIDGIKGIHLCGNPDWDFLLNAEIDVLSFDAYRRGEVVVRYESVRRFIEEGKILEWGIVPTNIELLDVETEDTLIAKLETLWDFLVAKGVDKEKIVRNAQLAPATCNLVGARSEEAVEKAYDLLLRISARLKAKYNLE
jgi:methionine synthase II (cobalamin-independent)